MKRGRLALSLNDDGTITLRCDADAFFAHADEIRRLLTGDEEASELTVAPAAAPTPRSTRRQPARALTAPAPLALDGVVTAPRAGPPALTRAPGLDPDELRRLWLEVFPEVAQAREPAGSRDLSLRGTEVLAAGYYLTCLRGFEAFTRADLRRTFAAVAEALAAAEGGAGLEPVLLGRLRAAGATGLVHLTRRGWVERVSRGAYRLTRRALDRVESLRGLPPRPDPMPRPLPELPDLTGLSRFLRLAPTAQKWRRVLHVAYFLHEHCGIAEFDQRLLTACFQRLRGLDAPGSLPALISQQLCRRRGLLERGSGRGKYRLTVAALEELRRDPRLAESSAIHRARAVPAVSRTG